MDQIYTDFTTKFLPQVQEGLVITKDYFIDLFGRYITYLIILDLMAIFFSLVVVIASVVYAKKLYNKAKSLPFVQDPQYLHFVSDLNDNERGGLYFAATVLCFLVVVFSINIYSTAAQLVKTIYIPEVRVYEELKPLLSNQGG